MSTEQWEAMRGQIAFLTGDQARAALSMLVDELLGADRRGAQLVDQCAQLIADLDAFGEDERVSMVEAYRVSEVENVVNRWEAEYAVR